MINNKYSEWVGRQEKSSDEISELLVKRIAVTFNQTCPCKGENLPPLWHWAFFQEPVEESKLGPDGHPARGIFLPPIEGRNRMWAGGRVHFISPLIVGYQADRCSTITSVVEKNGKTGDLLFVTVEHVYSQNGITCVKEEQDIVYRTPSPPKLESSRKVPALDWRDTVFPSPVMLFRYSAVTFNGHRIHYDHPYATEHEGYAGLVVHGPMIATLLLSSFTSRFPNKAPLFYSYRGLRPLIAEEDFEVGGAEETDFQYSLWAYNHKGPAHYAELRYKEMP